MGTDLSWLIPSKDVRDHLMKIRHEFSNAEKAFLAHHNEFLTLNQELDLLRILNKITASEHLKNQLTEYLDNADTRLKEFKRNDNKDHIYILEVQSIDDEDDIEEIHEFIPDDTHGVMQYPYNQIFLDYNEALDEGRSWKKHFTIGKKQLGRFVFSEFLRFDSNGSVIQSFCLPARAKGNPTFEFQEMYFHIPHPFERGDIVNVMRRNILGIVEPLTEESQRRKKILEADGFENATFRDDFIDVACLQPDGSFRVIPFSCTILEKVNLSDALLSTFSPEEEVLYHASQLYKGKGSLSKFSAAAIRYNDYTDDMFYGGSI